MSWGMDVPDKPAPYHHQNDDDITLSPVARWTYLAVGWLFLILGAIGAFLPVIPTVPFLIVTAWAWSKSSKKLHHWLYSHPHYGPYLHDWDKYGVIPRTAKIWALAAMSGGWLFATLVVADSWVLPVVLGLIHLSVAAYIVSRPSNPPAPDDGADRTGVTPYEPRRR